MSELVSYPSNILPMPLLSGHSIQKKTGVLSTPMDSGHKRRRRRFKNIPSLIPVKFSFSSDEYAVFESWFENQISDGADRFVMPVKTATGIQYQTAVFDGDGYKAVPKSQRRWLVTAKLEIKKLDLLDPEITSMLIEVGYSMADISRSISALDSAVNSNDLSN